jgi:hypothetical protein
VITTIVQKTDSNNSLYNFGFSSGTITGFSIHLLNSINVNPGDGEDATINSSAVDNTRFTSPQLEVANTDYAGFASGIFRAGNTPGNAELILHRAGVSGARLRPGTLFVLQKLN